MTRHIWLSLACALSGCTLTLSQDPQGDAYGDGLSYAEGASLSGGFHASTQRTVSLAPSGPSDSSYDEASAFGHTSPFRTLTLHTRGMSDDLRQFTELELASDNRLLAVAMFHDGLAGADAAVELPATMLGDQRYTLIVYTDSNGNGRYDEPPIDRAWRIPVPSGATEVTLDAFASNPYFDVERDAPYASAPIRLTFSDMDEYRGLALEVRVLERGSGRLVSRVLRRVPGDRFDLDLGAVTRDGTNYQVDVAVDIDADGHYDRVVDDSWRITGTADSSGLLLPFAPNGPYVDVGFSDSH